MPVVAAASPIRILKSSRVRPRWPSIWSSIVRSFEYTGPVYAPLRFVASRCRNSPVTLTKPLSPTLKP